MQQVEIAQGADNPGYLSQLTAPDRSVIMAQSAAIVSPGDALGGPQRVPWGEAVSAFLDAALDSPNTKRAYGRHLRNAGMALGVDYVDELTGSDLARYRGQVTGSQLAASSQRQALSALRAFLGWVGDLQGHRLPARVVAVALKGPRANVVARYNVLTEAEIGNLFATVQGTRERALLGVMLGSGLRVAEVARLSLADVVEDLDGGTALHVRSGKGRKDRLVPIGPEVNDLVRDYLVETGRFIGGNAPLFIAVDRGASRRKPGLTPRAISRLVREMALGAGISTKKISPHSLRHSFAIRCLRAGANVVAVSRLLGHSSIGTTQTYLDHLAGSELRASVPPLPLATNDTPSMLL